MKKLILTLITCLMFLGLCGCHGSKSLNTFAMPEELDTSRNIEITFWAKNDTNKAQADIYRKAVEDFHKLYPNITVTLKAYTDYARIYEDVITNISTQTTPNVCIAYPDHIATYITGSNVVVSLDELMYDGKYGLGGSELKFDGPTKDEIIGKFLEEGVINGSHYALPYMRSTEATYINKTMVEELGFELPEVLTWDFLFEVGEAANTKDEEGTYLINGQKTMIPIIYKSTDNMMIQMLKQKNADYSDSEGNVLLFNDTTKDLLMMIGEHAKTGAFSTFKISSYPGNFLNANQSVFGIDSTAGATWMGSHAPLSDIHESAVVEFETAVMTVPQFDENNITMISQGPSICIFNKNDPQEVLASWLFAQFLLTNDVQVAYAETEGYVPVTSKAQNSEEYQDYLSREGEDYDLHYDVKIKAAKLLLENIDNTFVTPVFNGSANVREASGSMIENVTKSTNMNETVDDSYIEDLFERMNSRYHLDQIGSDTIEKDDLGPLPSTAKALLIAIGATWLLIGIYSLIAFIRNKRVSHR